MSLWCFFLRSSIILKRIRAARCFSGNEGTTQKTLRRSKLVSSSWQFSEWQPSGPSIYPCLTSMRDDPSLMGQPAKEWPNMTIFGDGRPWMAPTCSACRSLRSLTSLPMRGSDGELWRLWAPVTSWEPTVGVPIQYLAQAFVSLGRYVI